MSEQINKAFKKYRKVIERQEYLKVFINQYCEHIFRKYELEDVQKDDKSERIRFTGYYSNISGWKNVKELVLSYCYEKGGEKRRLDHRFMFDREIAEAPIIDKDKPVKKARQPRKPKTKAVVKEKKEEKKEKIKEKEWKDFTDEEKEAYKKQKEKEKVEIDTEFETFIKTQTLKEVFQMFDGMTNLHEVKDKTIQFDERIKKARKENPEKADKLQALKNKRGYSLRNTLLVLSQARKRKDSKFVGILNSFSGWMMQGVHVNKNPDKSKPYGYAILVPIFKKKKVAGLAGFKLGTVFDISQTNKYEEFLETRKLADQELELQDEIEYKQAVKFTKSKFRKIKIQKNFKRGKGVYDLNTNTITVGHKSSHDLFHQLGYHIIFSELELSTPDEKFIGKNEILAEMTCYILMKKFEESQEYKINYDFAYSKCWAVNILKEFKFRQFETMYYKIVEYVKKL